LQRILYGGALVPFVKIEVIGKNLLKEMKESYNLLLVNDELLFQIQEETEKPVIMVKETKLPPREIVWEKVKEGEYLFQPSEVDSPLRIFLAESGKEGEVREVLQEVSQTMKITEPFGRVEEAVITVIKEKEHET
jgi:hypothetical protein